MLLGADQTKDAAKAFTINGNVATTKVALGTVPSMEVLYVPGGVADLTPGGFGASLALAFNDTENDSGAVGGANGSSQGRLRYDGVSTQAYAYGVVRSEANGAMERSFLRVGCLGAPTATGVCNIFLSCYGQDGTPYFGQTTVSVRNNATEVFDSNEIATALGGGWESGRGRCDLLTDGTALQVQHMIRSGGIQVNNSVVVDDMGIVTK